MKNNNYLKRKFSSQKLPLNLYSHTKNLQINANDSLTPETVKKKYLLLVKKYHPDISSLESHDEFRKINNSYIVVMNYLQNHKDLKSKLIQEELNVDRFFESSNSETFNDSLKFRQKMKLSQKGNIIKNNFGYLEYSHFLKGVRKIERKIKIKKNVKFEDKLNQYNFNESSKNTNYMYYTLAIFSILYLIYLISESIVFEFFFRSKVTTNSIINFNETLLLEDLKIISRINNEQQYKSKQTTFLETKLNNDYLH